MLLWNTHPLQHPGCGFRVLTIPIWHDMILNLAILIAVVQMALMQLIGFLRKSFVLKHNVTLRRVNVVAKNGFECLAYCHIAYCVLFHSMTYNDGSQIEAHALVRRLLYRLHNRLTYVRIFGLFDDALEFVVDNQFRPSIATVRFALLLLVGEILRSLFNLCFSKSERNPGFQGRNFVVEAARFEPMRIAHRHILPLKK